MFPYKYENKKGYEENNFLIEIKIYEAKNRR